VAMGFLAGVKRCREALASAVRHERFYHKITKATVELIAVVVVALGVAFLVRGQYFPQPFAGGCSGGSYYGPQAFAGMWNPYEGGGYYGTPQFYGTPYGSCPPYSVGFSYYGPQYSSFPFRSQAYPSYAVGRFDNRAFHVGPVDFSRQRGGYQQAAGFR
jgi:hypothetical protein